MHFFWLIIALTLPGIANAYVGSGIGLAAITGFFAFGLALLTSLWGFIWQPLKKYRQKKQASEAEKPASDEEQN